MNPNPEPTLEELFPLPAGIKLRTRKFGDNPVSPLVLAPVGKDVGDSSAPRPAFEISWENQPLGVTVQVREQENGNLQVEAFCTNAELLDKAAVSVGLVGTAPERMIRKSIQLRVPEPNGCSGSADFGSLTDAVKELGPQLRVVVFLLLE